MPDDAGSEPPITGSPDPASGGITRSSKGFFSDHVAAFPITSLLIAFNVLVFVAIVVTGLKQQPFSWANLLTVVQRPDAGSLLRWGANFGPLTASGPWWEWARLLTNTFVHVGIVHLAVNMWALLNLGAMAEYLFGRKSTLIIYLLTGIAGSVTSLAWHPAAVSAGASGAIFGIAGALLVAFRSAHVPLPRKVVTSTSASLLVFAIYNLAYGLVSGKVDNAAHLGGLAAGVIFGFAIVMGTKYVEPGSTSGRELSLGTVEAVVLGGCLALAAILVGRAERYIAPLDRGEIALHANNVPGAIQELNRAVALRPRLSIPRVSLGKAYLRAGELARAETQLKEAVRLDPRDADAWRELGFLYLGTHRAQEGTYAFSRAVDLQPKSAETVSSYALALQMANRLPEAIATYQRALRLDSRIVPVHYNLALAYIQSGKYDEAIANLNEYMAQERSDPNAWAALAEAYRRKGMLTEAEQALQKAQALKGSPRTP